MAETDGVASAIIDQQRAAREAKTARLREALERMESRRASRLNAQNIKDNSYTWIAILVFLADNTRAG